MAKIQAPNWCKDAIPTQRGWERDGELLVARKHRQDELDEYFGVSQPVIVEHHPEPIQIEEPEGVAPWDEVEEEVEVSEPELLTEAPIGSVPLAEMTKTQLLDLAAQLKLDIKSWQRKDEIIEVINECISYD